jgi:hypothetical protein
MAATGSVSTIVVARRCATTIDRELRGAMPTYGGLWRKRQLADSQTTISKCGEAPAEQFRRQRSQSWNQHVGESVAPDDSQDAVRSAKIRIRDEAEKDPDHRLAVFTQGREIENHIDASVFRRAVARLLKIEGSMLLGLQLSEKKRYVDEIVDHLGLQGDAAKTARRKLQDKVGLAELVVEEWTADAQVPAYVDTLRGLVRRSRLA